uniref:Uncharacterized protein n=1 Tax=Trachymyrmex cornetzi TaxID=471704 RepID=A0A195E257_9HYME|nr:hypothetical protein ALC57_08400 [Trachymyrmex cornetzi]
MIVPQQKWFNHNPQATSRYVQVQVSANTTKRSQSQQTFAISKESRHVYPVGGQGRGTVTDGIRPRERIGGERGSACWRRGGSTVTGGRRLGTTQGESSRLTVAACGAARWIDQVRRCGAGSREWGAIQRL